MLQSLFSLRDHPLIGHNLTTHPDSEQETVKNNDRVSNSYAINCDLSELLSGVDQKKFSEF